MNIVVALGGNALGNTPEEQKALVKNTAISLADLVEAGHSLTVVHGNGPQVGMIQSAFDEASQVKENIPLMPLPECGSMSQGYIGFHLQNALLNEFNARNILQPVATVVTQMLVAQDDPGFKDPTKPIGSFIKTEAEIKALQEKMNLPYVEDSGRGYRFVVASPKPVDVLEKASIQALLAQNHVVIAAGGGGIPVIRESNQIAGVPAVIDKDASSAKLAEIVDADLLIILTAVPQVMINFGKPNQKALKSLTIKEANFYIEQGQFAKGSMLPKVEAALDFVKRKPKGKAIIAALEDAKEATQLKAGTIITNA